MIINMWKNFKNKRFWVLFMVMSLSSYFLLILEGNTSYVLSPDTETNNSYLSFVETPNRMQNKFSILVDETLQIRYPKSWIFEDVTVDFLPSYGNKVEAKIIADYSPASLNDDEMPLDSARIIIDSTDGGKDMDWGKNCAENEYICDYRYINGFNYVHWEIHDDKYFSEVYKVTNGGYIYSFRVFVNELNSLDKRSEVENIISSIRILKDFRQLE